MNSYRVRIPLLIITVSLISFIPQAGSQSIYLNLADAEKILGERTHITDSTVTINDIVTKSMFSFIADSLDKKSGKTGALYFLLDEYKDVQEAHKIYTKFYEENKDHEGVEILHDVGDEAYFHSDGENFYYISIRKGNKLIIMKVNKITSKTSLDEFNIVARNLASKL